MSLFDSASLVVTPNGYKAGKLYSIKPISGAGDLDVVRATSATRVNANGLIEIPRTNLLLRSEEFDNAYWTKTRTTIVQNSIIAPDGNLTADKLIDDTTASATHQISRNVSVASGAHTMSVFAKKGEYNFIRFWEDVQTGRQAFFNLDTGVATNVNMDSVSIVDFGNGWYRCIATINIPSAGNFGFRINLTPNGTTTAYNGTGTNGVFIWGAQLEVDNVATEYIPTTSVIRTKFAGITQDGGSANNIPRLDYTNGSCPSILVEPLRTNLVLYSEQFDNAYWTKSNSIILVNQAIAPNGTTTADKLVPNTSNGIHSVSRINQFIAGGYYSVFAKADGYEWILLTSHSSVGPDARGAFFNVKNGTIGTTAPGVNAKIEDYGNGWYRCSISEGNQPSSIWTVIATNANNVLSFTGNGTDGVLIWGAQNEQGANATSYIPTVASTVTRNADVISKSGIADLIGQSDGTLFVELFSPFNSSSKEISLSDGTLNNRIAIGYLNIANRFTLQVIKAGVSQVSNTFIPINQDITNKIILSYSLNNYRLFINGVLVFTDNVAEVFTNELSIFQLNRGIAQNPYFGRINSIQLYKTALTDQQCIELTTL